MRVHLKGPKLNILSLFTHPHVFLEILLDNTLAVSRKKENHVGL